MDEMEERARSLYRRLRSGIYDIEGSHDPSYYLHLVHEADKMIDELELEQFEQLGRVKAAVYQLLVLNRNQMAAYMAYIAPRLGVRQARSTK